MKSFKTDLLPLLEQSQPTLLYSTLLILTQLSSGQDEDNLEKTFKELKDECLRQDLNCRVLYTTEWYMDDTFDTKRNRIVLKNYLNNTKVTIYPQNTIVLCKGMDNLEGNSIKMLLKEYGCRIINDSGISGNKFENYLLFKKNSIPTPKTMLLNKKTDDVISDDNNRTINIVLKSFENKFPLILKTIPGSRGVGTTIIESEKSLKPTLQALWNLGGQIIIQEYLPIDGDIRVYILGGKFLTAIKRNKVKGDIRSNYSQGAKLEHFDLKDVSVVEKVTDVLKLEWAGVDLAIVDGKQYIIEVNTSPDTDLHVKGGVNVAREFVKYILKR